MTARVSPPSQPFPSEIQTFLDARMKGRPPLWLFTTLVHDPRLFARFFAGSLLDDGSNLSLRNREIVIDRITALSGSEYEWGVHVAIFGQDAGLTEAQIASIASGAASDPCWNAQESALIAACDQLHAACEIDDATWTGLKAHFSDEAIIELLMLAGRYRLVSYLTNALRMPLEPFAPRFPQGRPVGAAMLDGNWPRQDQAVARISPAVPPLAPSVQARLDQRMKGRPPLTLFMTLARDARLYERFFVSGMLDKGNLTLRNREIIIDRITALSNSEYEWGVHVTFFGEKAELTEAQIVSTARGSATDACWNAQERALISACEQLHATCDLDDQTWDELKAHFTDNAIIEILMVAGSYRTVSYLTNAIRMPLEGFARRFPDC